MLPPNLLTSILGFSIVVSSLQVRNSTSILTSVNNGSAIISKETATEVITLPAFTLISPSTRNNASTTISTQTATKVITLPAFTLISPSTRDNDSIVTSTKTSTRFVTLPAFTGRPSGGSCCYVVLDDIEEMVWNRWMTKTVYDIVNLTSYTTYITPLPTTTITSVDINVYLTNATYSRTTRWTTGLKLYKNGDAVIMPKETVIIANPITEESASSTSPVLQKASQVVTHGVTIQSPDAVYIYSKFRIMTAQAVQDSLGNMACVGKSTLNTGYTSTYIGTAYSPVSSYPYSTYIDSQTLYQSTGKFVTPVTTVFETHTWVRTVYTTWYTTQTTTREPFVVNGVNTNLDPFFMRNGSATQEGVEIALETPFFFKPLRGNYPPKGDNDWTGVEDCGWGPPMVNYGYPSAQFLRYLFSNPDVLAKYPKITDCVPGGPPIVQTTFSCVAPMTEARGGNLIESTIIMVDPNGGRITTSPIPTAGNTDATGHVTGKPIIVPPQQQTLSAQPSPPLPGSPMQTTVIVPQQTQASLGNPPANQPQASKGNIAPPSNVQSIHAVTVTTVINGVSTVVISPVVVPQQPNTPQEQPLTTLVDEEPYTIPAGQSITIIVGGIETTIKNTEDNKPMTTTINGAEIVIPGGQAVTTRVGGTQTTIDNPLPDVTIVTVIKGTPTTVISKHTNQPSNIGDAIGSFIGITPSGTDESTPAATATGRLKAPLKDSAGSKLVFDWAQYNTAAVILCFWVLFAL